MSNTFNMITNKCYPEIVYWFYAPPSPFPFCTTHHPPPPPHLSPPLPPPSTPSPISPLYPLYHLSPLYPLPHHPLPLPSQDVTLLCLYTLLAKVHGSDLHKVYEQITKINAKSLPYTDYIHLQHSSLVGLTLRYHCCQLLWSTPIGKHFTRRMFSIHIFVVYPSSGFINPTRGFCSDARLLLEYILYHVYHIIIL